MKKPSVILFDIDDTLYSTASPHEISLKTLEMISKNYNISIQNIYNLYISSRNQIKLGLGEVAASHSRLLYFQRMLESIDCKDIPLESLKLENIYWDTFLSSMSHPPGLVQLFQKIKSLDIKIGIVTDLTASIQMKKLIQLKVSPYIDALVTSEESGLDKPNFTCFSLINDKLNPEYRILNYWMVGDSLIKDLKGSKIELNATTFHLTNEEGDHPCADHRISSIIDLGEYL